MKSLKPILLVLAGVLITIAMFSFKNEEPVKEYCRIGLNLNSRHYCINYDNSKEETYPQEFDHPNDKSSSSRQQVNLINKLAKEGWHLCGIGTGSWYLERTKQ